MLSHVGFQIATLLRLYARVLRNSLVENDVATVSTNSAGELFKLSWTPLDINKSSYKLQHGYLNYD